MPDPHALVLQSLDKQCLDAMAVCTEKECDLQSSNADTAKTVQGCCARMCEALTLAAQQYQQLQCSAWARDVVRAGNIVDLAVNKSYKPRSATQVRHQRITSCVVQRATAEMVHMNTITYCI